MASSRMSELLAVRQASTFISVIPFMIIFNLWGKIGVDSRVRQGYLSLSLPSRPHPSTPPPQPPGKGRPSLNASLGCLFKKMQQQWPIIKNLLPQLQRKSFLYSLLAVWVWAVSTGCLNTASLGNTRVATPRCSSPHV